MEFVDCLLVLVAVSSVATGECPTWFQEKNGMCECGSDLGGTIMCNKYTQTVAIAEGYCMSYENISQEFLVGICSASSLLTHNGTGNRAYYTLSRDKRQL